MPKPMKELIRDELRNLGVTATRLVIGLTGQQIIFSGELASFYQVQLAQLAAKRVAPEFQVVLNLSVFDPRRAIPSHQSEESKVHVLRNQLNEYGIALQLVSAALKAGDVPHAIQTVDQILGRIQVSDHESNANSSVRGSKCLIVEGNHNESQLLCGFLRSRGALVTQAHDSATAYRLLDAGFLPDILLLDMHLPNANGKQIADRIRGRDDCRGIGIVAISGTHPNELGLSVKPGQLDAWLPKPLNVDFLIKTLDSFLRISKRENASDPRRMED